MKQTNNALKYLLAQYRAIFKNAYFKGLATAVLLTAGLAAGQAQADNLNAINQLPATADDEVVIAGTNSDYELIQLQTSGKGTLNGTITINSGSTNNGNYIAASGGELTITGTGTLNVDINAAGADYKATGINIVGDGGNATVDITAVNVTQGSLNLNDKNSNNSGSVILKADTITVGGNGFDDSEHPTAFLNLTAAAATANVGVTLGRAANPADQSVTASNITVSDGGVVKLDAGTDTKNSITVLGASFNVEEGGLLVQTGSSGSNTIRTDVLTVAGDQVVSGGTATITSHQTTMTGDLLVEGGILNINPDSTLVDSVITEVGSYTFASGSEAQISGDSYIKVAKGNTIVEDGASLIAKGEASQTGGYITVRNTSAFTGDYDSLAQDSAQLTIGSATLKNFLGGAQDYQALTYDSTNNTLTRPTDTDPDATPSKSAKGALELTLGGRLHLSDTTNVDLSSFNFNSSTNIVANAINISNGGIISGQDLSVSKALTTNGTTPVSNLTLYIEAQNLTLGSSSYSGTSSLGFKQAKASDNINLVASGNTFTLVDTVIADRDYFVQATDEDGDLYNTTTLNGTGTITGDDIQIGSGSNTGSLSIAGGAWTSDSNITIVSGSLAVTAAQATSTPNWVNNGNPASLTLTGNVALAHLSDYSKAEITVTGASGADATLDLTKANLQYGSGSITVSGNTTTVSASTSTSNGSPFDTASVNDYYAQNATRGKIGWGKLLLNAGDFNEFLTSTSGDNTKFSIGSGGYVSVDGTLTGEHSFSNFSGAAAANGGIVAFTGAGVLDINGSLNLYTGAKDTPNTAATAFDIGSGTIVADAIDIKNYNTSNKGVITGVTISGGTLEVRNSFSTNTSSLTFSGDGTAQLTLAGDFSETGSTQGTVTTGANGLITLGQSGAIVVQGGDWNSTADINVSGANSSFTLDVDQEDIDLAHSLSTEETTVYAASFTGDNFAGNVANALSVGEATRATFNTMQLDNAATVNVDGKLLINGLTGEALPEEYTNGSTTTKNPAYVNKGTTAGIDLGTATIKITGGSVEFGATATAALIQQGQSGTGWTTDRVNAAANKSDFAVSDAIADTKFYVSDFGELKFNLTATTLLDKYDARFLTQTLLEGYDTSTFKGYLNLGDAELDIPFTQSPIEGVMQVAWDEVADFADLTYGAATTEKMKNAIITNIDSRNDFVKGHYGSLQVDVDPSKTTLSLGGNLSLHHAVGGYFVFSGTPTADGTGMTAVGVALGQNGLELENGGKIGSITGSNNAGNDVYFTGTGTTEVLGSISDIDELYIENATSVTGDVEAHYLDLATTLDVVAGANGTEGDISVNGGDLASTAVINAHDLSIGYVNNSYTADSLGVAGNINLTGAVNVNSGHDLHLMGGKVSAVNATLADNSANIFVGYEPEVGEKDDPTTDYYNESQTYGGYLEVTGKTVLNGGVLAVDPDYAQPAAMASLNNLGVQTTPAISDIYAGTLDGLLYVGRNAALGIGSQDLATLQAKAAPFLNANGAFKADEIGSMVYLCKAFNIDSTKAGLILTSQAAADFVVHFNDNNASAATGVFADFDANHGVESQLRSNMVYLGANTAILVDSAVMTAADTSAAQTKALVSFTDANKGTVIADGGDIIVDGDVRASTYQIFSNADIKYLDGTNYDVVVDSQAAHYDHNIDVSTENDFLIGVVAADGTVTLGVNEARASSIMRGASVPVLDTLIAYAQGYNGDRPTDEEKTAHPVDTVTEGSQYTQIAGVSDDRLLYTYDENGNRDYKGYNNYILERTISTGDGSAAETVARLATYGGAVQAAITAGASSYEAISGRLGMGATGYNLTVADNTQGAALWVSPLYKSSESDSFDAEGVDYGVDLDLYGVALGADYTLANGVSFGAMFNVGSGDVDGKDAGSAVSNDFDYYGFGVYGGYSVNNFKVVADLTYTVADNDLEGNTTFDKVGASLDTSNLSFGVTAQYSFDFTAATVTPHAGLRYSYIDVDDYDVDGEVVIASYDGDSLGIFSIPVGVTIAKEFQGDNWSVKPSFDLTLTGNFGDDETDGTVHWAGVENLYTNVSSEVIDNFTYGATLGVAAKTGNFSIGLGVNYTGSSNTDEYSVNANARFVF